jgi:hypothetical protein
MPWDRMLAWRLSLRSSVIAGWPHVASSFAWCRHWRHECGQAANDNALELQTAKAHLVEIFRARFEDIEDLNQRPAWRRGPDAPSAAGWLRSPSRVTMGRINDSAKPGGGWRPGRWRNEHQIYGRSWRRWQRSIPARPFVRLITRWGSGLLTVGGDDEGGL